MLPGIPPAVFWVFVGAAIIIGCALSFAMWAGSRLVWHHGGNVGRWVAARHMYGPRADD